MKEELQQKWTHKFAENTMRPSFYNFKAIISVCRFEQTKRHNWNQKEYRLYVHMFTYNQE